MNLPIESSIVLIKLNPCSGSRASRKASDIELNTVSKFSKAGVAISSPSVEANSLAFTTVSLSSDDRVC